MTTIANIAQRVLDENGLAIADFAGMGTPLTLTILEYKIDDAIVYVSLRTGATIAALSGSAGSKSITATDGQILVVKWLTNMMLKAYKEKGEQAGISAFNISYLAHDPDYKTSMTLVEEAIKCLKSLPIVIANDPLPTE